MLAKIELRMTSESSNDTPALDFTKLFSQMYNQIKGDALKCKVAVVTPQRSDAEVREEMELVSQKVRESFLQNSVRERPNPAGLAADFETQGDGNVDYGWGISLTDHSPSNFKFESLFCVGQRVHYSNLDLGDTNPKCDGVITEVIFTLGGQVRYSFQTDDGVQYHSVFGGWLARHTGEHRSEIQNTLGSKVLNDAIQYVAIHLGWSRGDAAHVVHEVVTMMSTFCVERNVHFSMSPLECYAVFLHLVDRNVKHLSTKESTD